jgi:hypothetical protein
MSIKEHEHTQMAYLLSDVIKGKFDKAYRPVDLWKFVETVKTETYKMADVRHWVYAPCWSRGDGDTTCFYSIYRVLMQKSKFKADMARIKKADTSYPIIIIKDDFDKYGAILDGHHRFAKLIIEGATTVKYKFISKRELDKLAVIL